MPLHAQVKGFLDMLVAAKAPAFHQLPVADSRKAFSSLIAMLPPSTATIAGTRDLRIPGPAGELPIRIYTPVGQGPFPIVMHFHGGGFVIGDLEIYDSTCREICAGADAIVVAVDYRLAPEHPFPAAPDDCLAATRWAAAHAAEFHGDSNRIVVGGDSAGGNLAAVTALRLRDEGGPKLRGQLLIYPVTDAADTESMRVNAEGYLLTRADMQWFVGHYVKDPAALSSPHLLPLHAPSLAGLPPAFLITAEFDPLRDEGEAYAAALSKAGVPVEFKRYDGAIHAFYTLFTSLELGRQAMDQSTAWLKKIFA